MGNYAYLTCSDYRGIYPIDRCSTFDAEKDVLVCDKDFVPLLWFALFREDDLKRARIPELPAAASLAPIARVDKALAQLADARPLVEALYPSIGSLSAFAEDLAKYVGSHGGRNVSIEWHEVALLHGEGRFAEWVRRALRFFSDPRKEQKAEAKLRSQNAALPLTEKVKILRAHSRSLPMQDALKLLGACGHDVELALARLRAGKTELEQKLDATDSAASYQRGAMKITAVFTCLSGIRSDEPLPPLPSSGNGAWNVVRTLGTALSRVPPWEQPG